MTSPTADRRSVETSHSRSTSRQRSSSRRRPDESPHPHRRRRHSHSGNPNRAYNNDATTGNKEGQQMPLNLSWRSDPNSSFSDWTLEIVTKGAGSSLKTKKLYHCHSNVLAWGPRRSESFITLFQQRLIENPSDKKSQIELNPFEASAFPYLLDFMYCEKQVPLSARTACALYLLADRFEIHSLHKAIENYVERSLSLNKMIEFIACARQYEAGDKLTFFANSKLCGYLVKYPDKAADVPPEVLEYILHKRQQCVKVLKGDDPRRYSGDWEVKRSRLLSKVVAACVTQHCVQSEKQAATTEYDGEVLTKSPILTRHMFEKLTSKLYLPHMDTDAAMKLLKVDGMLGKEMSQRDELDDMPLTCLQERCVQSLIQNWRGFMRQCNERDNGGDENIEPTFSLLSLSALSESLRFVAPQVLADLLVLTSLQYETHLAKEWTGNNRTIDLVGYSSSMPPDAIVVDEAPRPLSPLFMCGQEDDGSYLTRRSEPPKPEDIVRRTQSVTGSSVWDGVSEFDGGPISVVSSSVVGDFDIRNGTRRSFSRRRAREMSFDENSLLEGSSVHSGTQRPFDEISQNYTGRESQSYCTYGSESSYQRYRN